jgi:hypothetical protein
MNTGVQLVLGVGVQEANVASLARPSFSMRTAG